MLAELGSSGSPGTSDLLAITGNLDLSSSTDELDVSGGLAGGFYTIISYTGTRTGTFDVVTPGYTVDYSHAGEVRITSVPEPASFLLVAVGGLILFSLARRQAYGTPNA